MNLALIQRHLKARREDFEEDKRWLAKDSWDLGHLHRRVVELETLLLWLQELRSYAHIERPKDLKKV